MSSVRYLVAGGGWNRSSPINVCIGCCEVFKDAGSIPAASTTFSPVSNHAGLCRSLCQRVGEIHFRVSERVAYQVKVKERFPLRDNGR